MRLIKSLITLSLIATTSTVMASNAKLQQQLQAQGYQFIEKIPAPAGLEGWVGLKDDYPSTVFISNDQKYYIVGSLMNANNEDLTEQAIQQHAKSAVLDKVWENLENSTWILDGKADAPKVVYVFTDVNCPYCYQFWQQARPWVDAGKVQLRHIMVGVIRDTSRGQAATLLSHKDPAALFKQYNQSAMKKNIATMAKIPAKIEQQLDANEALMQKYGFYATPAMLWKNAQGQLESMDGLPQNPKDIFQ
ncbi:thiol:disulfide interchange protein DsbG [Acinetobacter larvae]|uniref:Thiol:disulfide interchange protein n=1 Tax=Acinetobacter larvae TaxID=1789224 RepID=A0A1B2M0G4_9GAMM|nr:thiol:disulfide interchange protein DsbG [Acinetobacter larvae]AOA58682.1 thiol:disulfide interchange protein DsbG [Acinetobacter larvae]